MKKFIAILACALCLTGCTNWERDTFNTLASSKAVIDGSQSAYEARTIPHNTCAYNLINKAKAAQSTAVDAMLTYEQVKSAKGNLEAQEAVVVSDIALVAPIIAQIQTIRNPEVCGGAK